MISDELGFLGKHWKRWNEDAGGQSALTLLAEDADEKLGVEFTPGLFRAAGEAMEDAHRKMQAAEYDGAYIRAAILARRCARAARRLNLEQGVVDKYAGIGMRMYSCSLMHSRYEGEKEKENG